MEGSPCHHKDIYDYIIAAFPIVISLTVAYIAYLQYKVNRHKFRLDLYNRRFMVYQKTLAYFHAYYEEDNENMNSFAKEFVLVYRESIFLFGKNSSVYKNLNEFQKMISLLITIDEKKKENEDIKALSAKKDQMRDLHQIMNDLEKSLTKWLEFSKIEN